jgi:hypothetical protein
VVVRNWNSLSPVITYYRRTVNNPTLWVNFEYMAVVVERANQRNSYPENMRRMPEDGSLLHMIE